MKKVFYLLLLLATLFLSLAACSIENPKQENAASALLNDVTPPSASPFVSDAIDKNTEKQEPNTSEKEAFSTDNIGATQANTSIDLDLTALSSTMVYAEVNHMMLEPDTYVGKRIKLSGRYYATYDDQMEQHYHFIIISDATACCAQGLEFVWNGEHSYPEDYPADETEIEIIGIWEHYEENGNEWYRIRSDSLHIL